MGSTRPVRRFRSLPIAALLALGLGAGCAQAPTVAKVDDSRVELERMRVRLAEREQTIVQLNGKLALLEARRNELADRLASFERERDAESAHSERIAAAEREEEVARAAERRESEPRPVLRLHGDRVESRSSAGELTASWQPPVTRDRLSVAPVPSLSRVGSGASSPPPLAAAPARAAEAEALYVQALDLVRKREFAPALRELDAFLRAFPGDVRAVRALFWRGEVLYAQREYARALTSYEEVLEREPRGEKAADALLRVARCQRRLGAAERARSTVAELRERFPDSEAARVALRLEQEDT